MMKFFILLLITAVFAFANVLGTISKVDGSNITLKLTEGKLNKGDSVELIYTSMSGMELDVGEGKVTSSSKKNTIIFLEKKKATPRKGMKVSLMVTQSSMVFDDSKVEVIQTNPKADAQQNDSVSTYMKGWSYYRGVNNKKDYKKARRLFLKAATKGNINALYSLAIIYKNSYGVEKDLKKAFYWFSKAANKNHIRAKYYLALFHLNGFGVKKDPNKAFEIYIKLAKLGYAEAQSDVGWMYFHGKGVKKNYKKAIYWYTESASIGYPKSQNNLGAMYIKGQGVPKNIKTGIDWYKKAARSGNKTAQKNLKAGKISW